METDSKAVSGTIAGVLVGYAGDKTGTEFYAVIIAVCFLCVMAGLFNNIKDFATWLSGNGKKEIKDSPGE